tara:strand:- start:1756 stop:2124 length:369 start_codon:yes stop_codon:yes gene_type:complete
MKKYVIIDSEGYTVDKVTVDESLPIAGFDASTWIEISDNADYTKKRYVDSAWVDLVVTLIELRAERDKLIAICDHTQLADSQLTDAKKAEWATYRQALRDLPDGYNPVANPTYPTAPYVLSR